MRTHKVLKVPPPSTLSSTVPMASHFNMYPLKLFYHYSKHLFFTTSYSLHPFILLPVNNPVETIFFSVTGRIYLLYTSSTTYLQLVTVTILLWWKIWIISCSDINFRIVPIPFLLVIIHFLYTTIYSSFPRTNKTH